MKLLLILGVALVLLFGESLGQRFSQPTFKLPQGRLTLSRKFRESGNEPLWLYQGDNIPKAPSTAEHPFLPSIIDDVKFNPDRRYARSLGTPDHYHGGRHSISRGSQSTGPTHPGYNRRNARSVETLASQEHLSSLPMDSQETLLRGTRSVETLASQEHLSSLPMDSQETLLRGTRSVETLASQEHLSSLPMDSQETLLRGTRSVETLASQEHLSSLSMDSQGTLLRGTRSVETLASQEHLSSLPMDSHETLLRGTRSVETLASQEQYIVLKSNCSAISILIVAYFFL
ncbi:hypothetical protein O3G_MSEX002499 [Manduca sexta]|uniref:Uncharacterized protein n=1 Tax=Manduca sexta TaxID=7130 RepID=A0A921YNS8_MANSE|nr:hypothetical protein O3G_MSEX002499 [Manduca sexta]KAG6442717.1 hypothetical protein O3G_MSEX002499 [Manduca sexta]KAG6442718.1 hypothetical protein O3G_MSEX002499 [Manduca sexta]